MVDCPGAKITGTIVREQWSREKSINGSHPRGNGDDGVEAIVIDPIRRAAKQAAEGGSETLDCAATLAPDSVAAQSVLRLLSVAPASVSAWARLRSAAFAHLRSRALI